MTKDSIGQEVKVGDYIAYKPARQATDMEHAEIMSFKGSIPQVVDMDKTWTKGGPQLKLVRTIFVKTFTQEDI